jgi:predicted phosphodiesterase
MEIAEKVLIAGDWHGNIPWMQTVLVKAAADGYRTLIHVGDLAVLWPGEQQFTRRLVRCLRELDLRLIFVDGNHDVHPKLRALPRNADGFGAISDRLLYAPRGHRWELDGVRFGALGGAHSIDKQWRTEGQTWWPQEDVTAEDVKALGDEPLDVLITHEAPAGINVQSFLAGQLPAELDQESYNSRLHVLDAVRATEPELVFCGHWHQRHAETLPGSGTRVEVLDREKSEGNLVTLHLEDLTIEAYPMR